MKSPLKRTDIPLKEAEGIWFRIRPFIEEYHKDMALSAICMDDPVKVRFGLKEMAFSIYQQGLMDCMELFQKGELDRFKDTKKLP